MRTGAGLAVALWLLPAAGWAATVESLEVDRAGEYYSASMRILLEVPAAAAFAVLSDVGRLSRLNDSIEVSERLPDNRLRTEARICFGFFCKHMRQLQTVVIGPGKRLAMTIIPAQSDLSHGEAEWRFEAVGPERTRLHYRTELEPDFWVPPFVGPWLLRRTLAAQALKTAKGIERVADERTH
ncbi:hypothetical protein PC39_03737 [Salinisphaera sp. PC39]|uniref:SRPBCC family protein n=1 Tax=Salinisphaera sp. PC39 TaxID=1304156 RepID=UPI0033426173